MPKCVDLGSVADQRLAVDVSLADCTVGVGLNDRLD